MTDNNLEKYVLKILDEYKNKKIITMENVIYKLTELNFKKHVISNLYIVFSNYQLYENKINEIVICINLKTNNISVNFNKLYSL